MGFATILPLIFGVSFQTPLVMLFLERIKSSRSMISGQSGRWRS